MPDEDKNFGGSLVLDFRKRRRHVKTIYIFFPFSCQPYEQFSLQDNSVGSLLHVVS